MEGLQADAAERNQFSKSDWPVNLICRLLVVNSVPDNAILLFSDWSSERMAKK